jgi:anti-sigma factor RsiW
LFLNGGKKVDCNFVRENLVAFLHGELDKKAVMTIHKHLSVCEVCAQEEIDLRKTDRLLDQFQFAALPENFDEQLHQKLEKIDKPVVQTKHDFRRIVYAIAATILVMIGLQFFGARILQSMQQPIHFKDFPTTQAVFRTEEDSSVPSLKERFIQRYLQSTKQSSFVN